jgi:hypothetical protein
VLGAIVSAAYGVTITGEVATLTLTVPALWVLVLLVLSGLFMMWTTTRDWLASVIERVRSEDVAPMPEGRRDVDESRAGRVW